MKLNSKNNLLFFVFLYLAYAAFLEHIVGFLCAIVPILSGANDVLDDIISIEIRITVRS